MTLVETMAVVAILCVLVAILFPVVAHAKHDARITGSLSHLRQLHLALKQYQADYDGDERSGSAVEMGLPWVGFENLAVYGASSAIWKSPCGKNPRWTMVADWIQDYAIYPMHIATPSRVREESARYGANFLTFVDMNCTYEQEDLDNPFLAHRGLGILLSGQLVNQRRIGDWTNLSWWVADPADEKK